MILDRLQDVIVAPSTPPGRGALALVRVSGSQTLRLCDQIFRGEKRLTDAKGNSLVKGYIMSGDSIIDEVIAGVYKAPHSYTTEDIVEFSLHGNPLIVDRVTELLIKNGARLATPGEFTERAYLYGRIDVTQAEAVLAAVESETEEGVSAAMRQLQGNLSSQLSGVSAKLKNLVISLEAQLEFPEEDVPTSSITLELSELRTEVENLASAFRRGRSRGKGLNVMLVGRPNVGKSTLFNALLGEDRSIVTSVPGTTRDIVTGTIRLTAGQLRLYDGAGIGVAESLPDKLAVKRAIGAANRADFVIIVLDAVSGFVPADGELLKILREKPGIIVWNKIDSVKTIPNIPDIAGEPLSISALKRNNLDLLLEKLKQEVDSQGEIFFANQHQENQLKKLYELLNDALDAQYPDMRSNLLKEAMVMMSGAERPDVDADILRDIFSRFCIGK
ncbi:tRNA uridine-5-carboxymethylaminomethyl(34) synthesis GTPase MnmE [bacterium]|nr:tRNA uridine-5-carboxymethylaminomethyl(34) synthesis GTPase MnmE [bacterium]